MTAQKKFTAVNTVTAQLHPQFLILYSILFLCNNYYNYNSRLLVHCFKEFSSIYSWENSRFYLGDTQ